MPRSPMYPPVPPVELPPARTVVVPGRGEFFLRDTALAGPGDDAGGSSSTPGTRGPAVTGGDPAPPVLLLHGWVVSADLNWCGAYAALADAGHRVLALDHRGHGRGLRSPAPFRLADCAADAAAVLRAIGVDRAIVVGYSMGGTIAQLMARDHPEVVAGVVYSATCQHFQDPATVRTWRWMGVMGVAIGLAPRTFYRAGLRRAGLKPGPEAAWTIGELMRHEARDVAEAGRELGRFDSRPWLHDLRVPTAMVLTSRDTAVSPAKQHELARASMADPVVEVAIDHLDVTTRADAYNPSLVQALAALATAPSRAAAGAPATDARATDAGATAEGPGPGSGSAG